MTTELDLLSKTELWVEDIPDDLAYGVSSTWVNFKAGFTLAEAMVPGSSRHMSVAQLLNLPAEQLRVHADSSEQQALVVAARLAPTVLWAQANGLLAIQPSGYSRDEIAGAVAALEQHEREMAKAVQDRALETAQYGWIGQWYGPGAMRSNVSGWLKAPVPVMWNVEKK